MDALWQDLKFGVRTLLKNPGFTAIAVLTLALGIGANASIFSVVNGILLRPLPYKDPDRLITFRTDFRGIKGQPGLAGGEILDLHSQSQSITDIGMIVVVSGSLTGEKMEQVQAASISENFMPILGVSPMIGRNLDVKADNTAEHVSGVLISYDLWKRTFNSDQTIVGRSIEVNNFEATVVGVMPRDFRLYFGPGTNVPPNIDLYFPADLNPNSLGTGRVGHDITTVARLKPEITLAQAQQEIDGIASRFIAQYPKVYEHSDLRFHLIPLQTDVVQEVKPAILALLGAVGFVLLIACSNVANMLLARGKAREKELVIRAALGAARGRIIRQLLTESLVLGLVGGVCGLLLASWGISLLLYLRPPNLPRQDDITLNGTVLAYALVISLLSGLIFGLVPSWRATRFNINETLKEGVRSSGPASGERLRSSLVIAQVALSLVLFIGAGLMIRTFAKLNQVNLGFNPTNVLTFYVPLNPRKFNKPEERLSVYNNVVDRMKAMPGAVSVGAISPLPLQGPQFFESYSSDPSTNQIRSAPYFVVIPGYFESMQINLIHGRYFTSEDGEKGQDNIIVDNMFAERNWPGENPIGKKILIHANSKSPEPVEIVGEVEHVKIDGPRKESKEQIYRPYLSEPDFNMFITFRSKNDPHGLSGAIKKDVEALGGGRPVSTIRMMNDYVADATADTRFALFLLGILALVALVLCAVGLYGVISYSVSQRIAEIGIRAALGAQPMDLLQMILGKGLLLTFVGIVIGLIGSFMLTRTIASLLFNVTATDPLTFVGVSVLLTIVGLLACYIPARRAAKIDPTLALRSGI